MTEVWIISIDGLVYSFLVQRKEQHRVVSESWVHDLPLGKAQDLARALGYNGPLPACVGNVSFSMFTNEETATITRQAGGEYETRYVRLDGSPRRSPFDREV